MDIFFNNYGYLCENCGKLYEIKYKKFKVLNKEATAIYDYDDSIKELLYKFKGCHDYELYPVFLYRLKNELKFLYKDYTLIPMPSYHLHDKERGFNHVEEMFKILGLPMMRCLEKIKDIKQSDLTYEERHTVIFNMRVKNDTDITNKKILLVDDVFTSGSTIKAAIKLLSKYHPKIIKVLVMSKTTIN